MSNFVQKTETIVNAMLTNGDVKRQFEKNYIETLVKLNPDLPPRYLVDFIHKAQLTGANPALNQIHLTTYYSKKLGHQVGVPVFSYHFFLNVANQTGEYEGVAVDSKMEEVFNPVTGKAAPMLVSTATVRRKNKGEVTFKARWNECADMKNMMWQTKPYIMLEKTAIANALRWAFPEALSGMYILEEITGEKASTQSNDEYIEATKVEKTEEKTRQSLVVKASAKQSALDILKQELGVATEGFTVSQKAEFIHSNLGMNWQDITALNLTKIMDLTEKVRDVIKSQKQASAIMPEEKPSSVGQVRFKLDD